MKIRALGLFVLGFTCAASGSAQTSYILRPSTAGSASDIAQRHGLMIVGPLDANRTVFRVTGPDSIPVGTVESDVDSDSEVADFEIDLRSQLPEVAQAAGIPLDQVPAPSSVSYGGIPVLNSYLSQMAPRIIRLWSTQQNYHVTGGGIVAIIDTGVDPISTVLAPSLVPGYDFVNNSNVNNADWPELSATDLGILLASSPSPASKSYTKIIKQSTGVILDQSTGVILDGDGVPAAFGHGTMVAGLIHLVAPTAQIMPLKAFRADGSAQLSDIIRAIYFAADNHADIINMSFTVAQQSDALEDAIEYAQAAGALCVAAAGNTGNASVGYPASFKNVIGVASTTATDQLSLFTSYGAGVFVGAPGENLITTYPGNNYAQVSGTSFSTPLVAGTLNLLYQLKPDPEYDQASNWLGHAEPISELIGKGRLNILKVISSISEDDSAESASLTGAHRGSSATKPLPDSATTVIRH